MIARIALILFFLIGAASQMQTLAAGESHSSDQKKQIILVSKSDHELPQMPASDDAGFQIVTAHSTITNATTVPAAVAILIFLFVLSDGTQFNPAPVVVKSTTRFEVLFRHTISPNAP